MSDEFETRLIEILEVLATAFTAVEEARKKSADSREPTDALNYLQKIVEHDPAALERFTTTEGEYFKEMSDYLRKPGIQDENIASVIHAIAQAMSRYMFGTPEDRKRIMEIL